MTANQLAYLEYLEGKRANQARERQNLASLSEDRRQFDEQGDLRESQIGANYTKAFANFASGGKAIVDTMGPIVKGITRMFSKGGGSYDGPAVDPGIEMIGDGYEYLY